MTKARKHQVDINTTPYYHCIARCVRRAYLCGEDFYSGKSYEHRKQWIVDEIKKLGEVFSIDICAFAIMSNHYHLVLHVNKDKARSWSEKEVINRWLTLFKGNLLVQRYINYEKQSKAELDALSTIVIQWRERLMDISWFMRCLNESIARKANEEDRCKGRFWEGRYKSQALLDEAALLTCMMYVDLNPIRAGMSEELEKSDFTSIQARIAAVGEQLRIQQKKAQRSGTMVLTKKRIKAAQSLSLSGTPALLGFAGNESAKRKVGIPFGLLDYFELIDWTGRAIRDDKKGYIPKHVQPLLQKLDLNQENWLDNVRHFERRFFNAVGRPQRMRSISDAMEGRSWFKGVNRCESLYSPSPPH